MICQEVQERLVSFLDRELADIEMEAVAGHLAECESCRAERMELERTVAAASRWTVDQFSVRADLRRALDREQIADMVAEVAGLTAETRALHAEVVGLRGLRCRMADLDGGAGSPAKLPVPPVSPTPAAIKGAPPDPDNPAAQSVITLRQKAELQMYQAKRIAADAVGFIPEDLIDNTLAAAAALAASLNDDGSELAKRLGALNSALLLLSKAFYAARVGHYGSRLIADIEPNIDHEPDVSESVFHLRRRVDSPSDSSG